MQLSQLLKIKQEEIFESVSILDSEELVDKAYEGLLAVLSLYPDKNKGLECYALNHEQQDVDILTPLVAGLYIPGSKRLYWAGHVDVSVDLIVARGSVYLEPPNDCDYAFVSVVEMEKFPKHIYNGDPKPRHLFKVITVYFYKKQYQKDRGKVGKFTSYFTISQDGSIYQAVDTHFVARAFRSQYETGPGAISLLADRLYIWNIDTIEPNTSFGFPAIVTFGIEPEMVKSLAYARSLPITESGRKRPILHWVKAHQRRIKDGIEIDIEKSLRGINEFNMGGLNFRITRPMKTTAKQI